MFRKRFVHVTSMEAECVREHTWDAFKLRAISKMARILFGFAIDYSGEYITYIAYTKEAEKVIRNMAREEMLEEL